MAADRTSAAASAEAELIAAAREGDEGAFAKLVDPLRGELHAHCYRMLASLQDAEDALQEALLRAWRGLSSFAARSSLRAWLYRIATNVCLDEIARRPKRIVPVDYDPPADPHAAPGKPLVESVWIEPYPDETLEVGDGRADPDARYEQRESIELAFIAALQHLPARQRAVLIQREVLGFSAREVAEMLDTTVASVNSALQRARAAVDDRLPAESQQANLRQLGDERLTEIVEAYANAWEAGNVEAIVDMLTEDAVLTMPPMPTWYRGRAAVAGFLTSFAFRGQWDPELNRFITGDRRVRLVAASAAGQPAFGAYSWDPADGGFEPLALQVLTLRGTRIAEIDGWGDAALFDRFGLAQRLDAA
ncbi:MAG: polymerase, sigma-24 subunit, subfamily [Solirubrobacterales bacterium]|nr:polymerase, sigma-24 subunit, subfamily [Solirubrobacterales bacterium]